MKSGLCHFVVLDDGNIFEGVFVTICKVLNFNYDVLSKQNHKGLTVNSGTFSSLSKLSNKIAVEDRKNNDIFVASYVVAGHA